MIYEIELSTADIATALYYNWKNSSLWFKGNIVATEIKKVRTAFAEPRPLNSAPLLFRLEGVEITISDLNEMHPNDRCILFVAGVKYHCILQNKNGSITAAELKDNKKILADIELRQL